MNALYVVSALFLAAIAYNCNNEPWWYSWYPWAAIFHVLCLYWLENNARFIVAFLLNTLLCIAIATYLLLTDQITYINGLLLLLNGILLIIQVLLRTTNYDYRWLLIVSTVVILPAGFSFDYQVSSAIAKPDYIVNEWYKPTSETYDDLPNRHLLSSISMTMKPNDPGTINAKVSANYINSTGILPGQTFSFNSTVGARTTDRGFVPSSSYMATPAGTISVPDIGGGICRTSTILHKAVVEGKLEVIEHHSHTAAVAYANNGEDVAVAWPSLDYVFRNNTYRVIEIICITEESKITIQIWSY